MICHGYIIIKIVIEIYARTVIILILFYCETEKNIGDVGCISKVVIYKVVSIVLHST
jgi:hypothetical protein